MDNIEEIIKTVVNELKILERNYDYDHYEDEEKSFSMINIDDVNNFLKTNHVKKDFRAVYIEMILKYNMTHPELCKKIGYGVSRVDNYLNGRNKKVPKDFILKAIIGMECLKEDAFNLLHAAGYGFSEYYKKDMIVFYHIIKKDYDINNINEHLQKNQESIL